MNIKNKIGTLKQRIEQRIGRSFGECDSCGKPTRSHKVGTRLVCHDCHTDHQPRLVTDGGWEADKEEQRADDGAPNDEISQRLQEALDEGRFDGDGPEPAELELYLDRLMAGAPDEYNEPWLFKCAKGGKDPYRRQGSWKDESNRLTPEEAIKAMERGFNIGLAGMEDDRLSQKDIDELEHFDLTNLNSGLTVRSQSRTGFHQPEFSEEPGAIPNIPHPEAGEIRAQGQYTIAPGSHIDPDDEDEYQQEVVSEAPDTQEPLVGYYTVEMAGEPNRIEYDDLPEVFRSYQEQKKREKTTETGTEQHRDGDTGGRDGREIYETTGDTEYDSNGNRSEIFDLRTEQIVQTEGESTDPTERWSSMFHGSQTDANMSISEKGILQCWRHSHSHGTLQILATLCDETESGNSGCPYIGKAHDGVAGGGCTLSTGELNWRAWKYAKKRNHVPSDDPIPRTALIHLALHHGIVTRGDVEDGWKIPETEYAEALELVEDEYGLNPGRDAHSGGSRSGERLLNQAAILPDIEREDTDPTITQPEHWDLTADTVGRAIEQERDVLIDAIMSSGKTYGALKAAYNRDEKIAFFSPRKDLYQQAKEYAIKIGYDESEIFIAPSINRDCPTYKGEHGERWKETLRKQYDLDASASDIHTHNDGIPCEGDDDERCNLRVKWNQLDHEQHKVVIGHYTHSHLPQLTKNRTNVFDEDTGSSFTNRIEGETLIRGINAFLGMDGSPPIDDFDELLEIRNDEMEKRRAMGWFNNHELGSESHKVIDNYEQGFHAKAPHAVYAILKAQPIEDGSDFERAYMPGVGNQARFFTTNEQKGEYYVELRDTPNLDYAKAVIALDGTPLTIDSDKFRSEVPEWSNALGVNLDHEQVLNNDERADYIRDTLNNKFVVTTDAVKPYSSGTYANPVEDKALCHAVKEKYGNGTAPVAVSSKTVCEQYKSEGFIEDGVVSEFEHHGNLRGSNKHADTRLAAILGSPHHGDHEIARRAAWLGETIDPEGRGKDRDYGSEAGNKILENMREHQILQSILRFGRDGGGATSVINTCAHPDWIHIEGYGSIEPWSEGMRELVEAWQDLPDSGVTSSDVTEHDAVSKSDRRVRSLLEKAATDHGLLTRRKGEGPNGAHLYADAGMSALEEEEMAEMEMPDLDDETMEDLGLVDEDGEPVAESVEISRYSLNTSNLRSAEGEPGESSGDDPVATDGGVAGGGDGPPRA